jgi:Spy/CpxP family protein refolding chaperone
MRFTAVMAKTFVTGGAYLLLCMAPLLAQPAKGGCKGDGMHDGKGPHGIMKKLNLTEEQKTKLEALRKEYKPLKQKQWKEMKAIRLKSKEELLKDKPDRAVLTQYSKEIAAFHEKMAESMTNHLLKAKTILTKEQFEKLLSKDFMEGMHKQKMNNGQKNCPHQKKGPPEDEQKPM